MRIFENNPDLVDFDITTTEDVINGYKFSELKENTNRLVLQGMQFMYSSAVNAADNASDKIKLGLSGYKTFQNIAQDVIDDFVPELLYYLVSDMAETLISFLDDEACEE